MNHGKVVVGLSGGVDSSVAAALLIQQGYQVEAVYLECYNEPGCRTDQDKADALKVAIKLGVGFQVLDFRKEYKEKVIEYFYREYEAGRTPNPDVMCNREIKFGIFYDWALRLNAFAQGYNHEPYDYVATGHYCRIKEVLNPKIQILNKSKILNSKKNQKQLQMAKDKNKDQSYFLWQIPQDHLDHILFPLGEMLKSEVRLKAKELGLITASKPDSMGICFIGEVDVNKLLRDRLGEKPGEVVMRASHDSPLHWVVIGTHKGLWFYTIGSRGGWKMEAKKQKSDMEPLYVIGKDKERNQLIVGSREETMRSHFEINYQIINSQILKSEKKLWVRIRNLGELHEVSQLHPGTVTQQVQVVTLEPLFGVAEGQSAVFYDKNGVLVGGGVIC